MTIKNTNPIGDQDAFAWVWLPDAVEPVVAGRLVQDDHRLHFNYERSYLQRENAMALYEPELPLEPGVPPLLPGLAMPGCIRDGSPDAWGRQVIINQLAGRRGEQVDSNAFGELDYLLNSGSNRTGALDFQSSSTDYIPRVGPEAMLEELLASVDRVEQGIPLSPEFDQAMIHGAGVGGARPKALFNNAGRQYIAKFSKSDDLCNIVKFEFVAMRLAELAGIDVARVQLKRVADRDVLLVERFDRVETEAGPCRKAMVSALTILELDEIMARYASYETLAEIIRHRFADHRANLRELFSRLVFNVLVGNTDDHARNHAAFWDGRELRLTPAYDICPFPRSGNEASQAMLINGYDRRSRIDTCLVAAGNFQLSKLAAQEIIDQQQSVIHDNWNQVCDEAELGEVDKNLLWKRAILNPFVFE